MRGLGSAVLSCVGRDDRPKCRLHVVVVVHMGCGLVRACDGERVGRVGRGIAAVVATLHADDGARGGEVEDEGVGAKRCLLGGKALEGHDSRGVEEVVEEYRRGIGRTGVVVFGGLQEKLSASGDLDDMRVKEWGKGKKE